MATESTGIAASGTISYAASSFRNSLIVAIFPKPAARSTRPATHLHNATVTTDQSEISIHVIVISPQAQRYACAAARIVALLPLKAAGAQMAPLGTSKLTDGTGRITAPWASAIPAIDAIARSTVATTSP